MLSTGREFTIILLVAISCALLLRCAAVVVSGTIIMAFALLVIVFVGPVRIYRAAVLPSEAFRAYAVRATSWACLVWLAWRIGSLVKVEIAKILCSLSLFKLVY